MPPHRPRRRAAARSAGLTATAVALALALQVSVTATGRECSEQHPHADAPGRSATVSITNCGALRGPTQTVKGTVSGTLTQQAPGPHDPNEDVSYRIDRIEDGAWAVLEDEDGRTFDVPIAWLPSGVGEGATVVAFVTHDATGATVLRIQHDEAATREAAKRIDSLRDGLKRGPAGDLDL